MSLMRQNVVQNEADYNTIRQRLDAILSIAQKHWQHGSQRPLDRRVEELAMCVMLWRFMSCCSLAPQCHQASHGYMDKLERIQERWLIRCAFDNKQDADTVKKSFRDIVILMNVFEVSGCEDCVKNLLTDI